MRFVSHELPFSPFPSHYNVFFLEESFTVKKIIAVQEKKYLKWKRMSVKLCFQKKGEEMCILYTSLYCESAVNSIQSRRRENFP